MTNQQKEYALKPWLNYILDSGMEIKMNEMNYFVVDDLEDYKMLYDSWISAGHIDFFMKNFSVPAEGLTIGCKGGTQFTCSWGGNKCDLQNYFKNEIEKV